MSEEYISFNVEEDLRTFYDLEKENFILENLMNTQIMSVTAVNSSCIKDINFICCIVNIPDLNTTEEYYLNKAVFDQICNAKQKLNAFLKIKNDISSPAKRTRKELRLHSERYSICEMSDSNDETSKKTKPNNLSEPISISDEDTVNPPRSSKKFRDSEKKKEGDKKFNEEINGIKSFTVYNVNYCSDEELLSLFNLVDKPISFGWHRNFNRMIDNYVHVSFMDRDAAIRSMEKLIKDGYEVRIKSAIDTYDGSGRCTLSIGKDHDPATVIENVQEQALNYGTVMDINYNPKFGILAIRFSDTKEATNFANKAQIKFKGQSFHPKLVQWRQPDTFEELMIKDLSYIHATMPTSLVSELQAHWGLIENFSVDKNNKILFFSFAEWTKAIKAVGKTLQLGDGRRHQIFWSTDFNRQSDPSLRRQVTNRNNNNNNNLEDDERFKRFEQEMKEKATLFEKQLLALKRDGREQLQTLAKEMEEKRSKDMDLVFGSMALMNEKQAKQLKLNSRESQWMNNLTINQTLSVLFPDRANALLEINKEIETKLDNLRLETEKTELDFTQDMLQLKLTHNRKDSRLPAPSNFKDYTLMENRLPDEEDEPLILNHRSQTQSTPTSNSYLTSSQPISQRIDPNMLDSPIASDSIDFADCNDIPANTSNLGEDEDTLPSSSTPQPNNKGKKGKASKTISPTNKNSTTSHSSSKNYITQANYLIEVENGADEETEPTKKRKYTKAKRSAPPPKPTPTPRGGPKNKSA